MNLPKDLPKDIITRLKSIEGQTRGLKTLKIYLYNLKQFRKALDKSHFLLLDEVYRKALAIKIVETMDACLVNCGNEDRIEFIRKQFPALEMDDLSQKMKEIAELKKRIDTRKEQSF